MKDALQQTEFYRQLGESIRKFRKKRHLSQDALARLVGLTRTSLTNIENGRQHPPLHTLTEIVEQLRVEFSELLPQTHINRSPVNIEALAEQQTRSDDELVFIQTGIGIKGKNSHGAATENPNDSADTST